METWPLGVFASIDAGLGVLLDVAHLLRVPTLHLHAPHAGGRSPEDAARFRRRLDEHGMSVTVVFAGFAGESYADIPTVVRTVGLAPEGPRAGRVAELKEIIEFTQHLGVGATGLHLGFVPHDPASTGFAQIVAVTQEVCDFAADRGVAIHLETGQEPADVLVAFLEATQRNNLFVNFDPANMILYGCGEPIEALRLLGPRVRSVHCKDACWSDHPGETWGRETPLGEGDVGVERFLTTLREIGYRGPLTIEREIPQDPERQKAEIGHALSLLTHLKERLAPS